MMNNIKIPLKIVIPAVLGVILIFSYVYFFYLPFSKKIGDLRQKISKLEDDITKAKIAKAKHSDLSKTLEGLNQQKLELEKKLPKEKNMPQLIKTIKEIADKYNITIRSISSTSAVKDGYFFRVAYNITISGTYHDIGNFFAAISLNERILNVENVTISGGDISNASFILVSYQYGG